MPVFPISFSIHKSKIINENEIKEKTKLLSFIVAGDTSTYIYNKEHDYYNDYQESLFAITTKKGGWDCLRHYEILANGCIPLFTNLENCPENTMTHFPKELIIKTNNLYKIITANYTTFSDIPPVHIEMFKTHITTLLNYTNEHLTNSIMAKFVLDKSGQSHTKTILFLSGSVKPDYLRCLTLTGFKDLFGSDCHDYPRIDHIYDDYPILKLPSCYGKGFTYTRNINHTLRNPLNDATIENDIRTHKYDIVIYGSYHRGMPFLELVLEYYSPESVILLCGEDCDTKFGKLLNLHHCEHSRFIQNGHNVFVRELL